MTQIETFSAVTSGVLQGKVVVTAPVDSSFRTQRASASAAPRCAPGRVKIAPLK